MKREEKSEREGGREREVSSSRTSSAVKGGQGRGTNRLLRGGGSGLLGDLNDGGDEVLYGKCNVYEEIGSARRDGEIKKVKRRKERVKLTCCVRAPLAEFSASTTLETFLFCFPVKGG